MPCIDSPRRLGFTTIPPARSLPPKPPPSQSLRPDRRDASRIRGCTRRCEGPTPSLVRAFVPANARSGPPKHEIERRQERRGRGALELHQQIVAIEPVLRVERLVREVELRGEKLRVAPLRLDVDVPRAVDAVLVI